MRKKIEYTHNGSFFKSLWLLVRSICNIAAFAFFWYTVIVAETTLIIASASILTLLVFVNFIFVLLKRK